MKKYLIILLLFVVACSQNQAVKEYYADTVKNSDFFQQKSYIFTPIEISLKPLGLQNFNDNYTKKYLRDTFNIEFRNIIKPKLFGKMIKRADFLYEQHKYDPTKEIDKIFLKSRSKLLNNFVVYENEKKILTNFYNNSKIRFIIVPVKIEIQKKMFDKSTDSYDMDVSLVSKFQVWDLLLGDVIMEKEFITSTSKTFFGSEDFIASVKKMVEKQAGEFYGFFLNK